MGKRGTTLFLFLCLMVLTSLSSPKYAYADDGFFGGLQDLVGIREVSEQPEFESEYLEEYEPVLRDGGEGEVEELSTNDAIKQVVTRANRVHWTSSAGNGNTILRTIRYYFETVAMRDLLVIPACCLVFAWWGVRKTLDVILSAYRRGRLKL